MVDTDFKLGLGAGLILENPTPLVWEDLHPFTKSSETGLGLSADSTALLSGLREVPICVYDSFKL